MNGIRKTIGILGAGSWGTAIAVHLAGPGGHPVKLWARDGELVARMAADRVNEEYLPGTVLPELLTPISEMADLLDSEIVFVVVPSHGFRAVLARFLEVWPAGRPLIAVSGTKGIEPETLLRMSEVTKQEAEKTGHTVRFAVLAGPSFAAELALARPTAAVIAAEDAAVATDLQEALSTPTLRLYSTADVTGVELCGATKNVIAIAAGVVAGLELGYNTLAALITRGLHEITRLGVACDGDPRTFPGLAGLGDLVLTCTGGLSRNRKAGLDLAAGRTLAEITGGSMVAEGIRNSSAIAHLAAQLGVEMPITQQMVALIYEGKNPKRAVMDLMTRGLKAEAEL
jgi:glycerol-3-phosphate dehydrogenase (NAD(P)+)